MSNHHKNILITGGAGFIGTHLIRRLLTLKLGTIHVIVEPDTDLWRFTDIINDIIIHEIDITNFDSIQTLIATIKPSTIFHLASYGGMPHQQNQQLIFKVNLEATINLVNACKRVGFECFINTGSSSEYGIKNSPMSESMNLEPVSDYGVSKAAATQFCLKEALFNILPIYTVRPFSVYGGYEAPTRLIPTMLVNMLLNMPLLLSSPHYVRDYIYIDDLIDLYVAIMQQKPAAAFIFNGGTGTQSSISDVVATAQSLRSTKINIEWGRHTPRPWEPKAWVASTAQSQAILDWHAQNTLAQGLHKTLSWFEKNMSLYNRGTHEPDDRKKSNSTPI